MILLKMTNGIGEINNGLGRSICEHADTNAYKLVNLLAPAANRKKILIFVFDFRIHIQAHIANITAIKNSDMNCKSHKDQERIVCICVEAKYHLTAYHVDEPQYATLKSCFLTQVITSNSYLRLFTGYK